jgi:hypothetical protein
MVQRHGLHWFELLRGGRHFALFQHTQFKRESLGPDRNPAAIFVDAKFETPEEVLFYRTPLQLTLFQNCDVSREDFSDVFWRKRANGKCMTLDEEVDLGLGSTYALSPWQRDPRNYRIIAELSAVEEKL